LESANTFEVIANEWLSKSTKVKEVTVKTISVIYPMLLKPLVISLLMNVTSPDVLALCRTIEARGTIETATV
jgi:hypothetical protein